MTATGRVVGYVVRADGYGARGDVVLVPLQLLPSPGEFLLPDADVVPLRAGRLDVRVALGDWSIDLGIGRAPLRVTVAEEHTDAAPLNLFA